MEADIASLTAMKVHYSLSERQQRICLTPGGKNYSRQGVGFSQSHCIFTSMENIVCLRTPHR
ncbi:protein of unknown function [Xenorhabdus bovienii]|uniref:Uncharacterized protein n=1 Tax=Xenorhabdus bovienii TaxID=40576 RepID=A0A0B6X4M4_XENBV|nr:protein of unknown function [Xenorhabdus bovienii]